MKISSKALKNASLGLGAVMMMGAGQAAFAHASILNTVNSGLAVGSTSYSRIGVNHACNRTIPATPIVAQSVVIPTINPIIKTATVTGTAAGAYAALPSSAVLGDYLQASLTASQTNAHTGAVTSSLINSLAGRFQLVQSKDVFTAQIEQRNANDEVIGWVSTKGGLGVNLHGEVPFRFSNIFFNPTSCLRNTVVQVAVADICNTQQKPPFTGLGIVPGVNLWIDNTLGGSANFPVAAIESGAGTTNLTINRDPIANPYPANCAAPYGSGSTAVFDLKIQPSAADLEQLQYPGWGTPVAGNTFK